MDEMMRGLENLKVDVNNLHREETFTDLKTGTIRRLTPVLPDGNPDLARKVTFFGQTQVMTRAGIMPLDFEIEATTLDEAARNFPVAVQKAVEDMVTEAREYQREHASSLIIPGGGPGKIQMP